MTKRGQVAMFIIAGFAIALVIGLAFSSLSRVPLRGNSLIDSSAVHIYVDSCVENQLKEGVSLFGLSAISEARIADYIDQNLDLCAKKTALNKGIEVEFGKVNSNVDISDRAVKVNVDYPILFKTSDSNFRFNSFDYVFTRVSSIGESSFAGLTTAASVAVKEVVKATATDAEILLPSGSIISGNGELKVEDRNLDGMSNGVVVGNVAFRLTGVSFSPYAQLSLPYKDIFLPKGVSADSLVVARYDPTSDVWVSVESSVKKEPGKGFVVGNIKGEGLYAIVAGCKQGSENQLVYTGWIYREQLYSSDRSLVSTPWSGSNPFFASESHKLLKLSGGTGWNDNGARLQSGTPNGKASIKDWDSDDVTQNNVNCNGCVDVDNCKLKCQDIAKKKYKDKGWKDTVGKEYLEINNDGIKDGLVPECTTRNCGACLQLGADGSCTRYAQCADSCTDSIQLATPNNYGYDSIASVGGNGAYSFKLQPKGNSCIAWENAFKFDFRSIGTGGLCNDECKAKLNGIDINVDNLPVKSVQVNARENKLDVDVINKENAASFARGRIELVSGTGLYDGCEIGKEIKSNCICGFSNVNVIEDVKKDEGDYGEWALTVKKKRFCCADGSVVDELSGCSFSGCPQSSVLQASNTGCACGTVVYDYARDGPGYCCAQQTCEGTACNSGPGFASGRLPENDLGVHEYRLELRGRTYSIYMDGKLIKSKESNDRPNQISFGNDLRPTMNVGTWTELKIDSIKVIDQSGNNFFIDEFDNIDSSRWMVDNGGGSSSVAGGWIWLKSDKPTNKFPFIKSAQGLKVFPDSGDFTLTLKMQFPKVTGHGVYFWASNVLNIGQDDSAPGGSSYGLWRLRITLLGEMVYYCGGVGGCGVKTCSPRGVSLQSTGIAVSDSCATPAKFGAHTRLEEFSISDFPKQLGKVKELTGDCGMVKNVIPDVAINPDIAKWSAFMKAADSRKLTPVLRLQGRFSGSQWERPDPTNDYSNVARAYVNFIKSLEAESRVKVGFVEIWNEPNLGPEWGGQSNPEEYGKFLLAVAKALRNYDLEDGKKEIKLMNGGLSIGAETSAGNYQDKAFISRMFETSPEVKDYLDFWSVHSYPSQDYGGQVAFVRNNYLKDVKIIVTEASWARCIDDSCDSISQELSPQQFVDRYKDADVVTVLPFLFSSSDTKWGKFSMVNPDTNEGNSYYVAVQNINNKN